MSALFSYLSGNKHGGANEHLAYFSLERQKFSMFSSYSLL